MGLHFGDGELTGVYLGSTPLGAHLGSIDLLPGGGGSVELFDDFNRPDSDPESATGLGTKWTNKSDVDNDIFAVVANNAARFGFPIGHFAINDPMIDQHLYNVGLHPDDGWVETKVTSQGEGGTDHRSIVFRRSSPDMANGVGMAFAASQAAILRRVASVDTLFAIGSYQPGDVFRLVQLGNVHTMLRNGSQLGTPFNDSGATAHSGSGYRSLGLVLTGSKPTIFGYPGPIYYSPSLDYVRCT